MSNILNNKYIVRYEMRFFIRSHFISFISRYFPIDDQVGYNYVSTPLISMN